MPAPVSQPEPGPADPAANQPRHERRPLSALRWMLAGSLLQRFISLACMVAITRLITKLEMGAIRQMLSLHMVLIALLPLGFDQLLIRETVDRPKFLKLLAASCFVMAGLLGAALLLGHPLAVWMLKLGPWEHLLWLAPVLCGLQAWKLCYKVPLIARLAYRRISIAETIYTAVNMIGGLALVLWRPTATSLYIALLAAEFAELIYLKAAADFDLPSLRDSIRQFADGAGRWKSFSFYFCSNQVLNATGANAPVLILASMETKAAVAGVVLAGKEAAAGFGMAYWLITVPIFVLVGAISRVAFPALAGLSIEETRRRILLVLEAGSVSIVPVLIWLATMSVPVVAIVLGGDWVEATAPFVRWIAFYCVLVVIFAPVSSLDILIDRPDLGFRWNVATTILRLGSVLLFLPRGAEAAVAAFSIVSTAMWLIWGIMMAHMLGAGQWVFHRAWLRAGLLWPPLTLALWYIARLGWHPLLTLALSGIPVAVYGLVALRVYPDSAALMLRFISRNTETGTISP